MKNQKYILYGMLIIIVICPIIIFLLDYYNIGIKNITKEYDWLSFIGSYIASIATIFLGYVSLKQNDTLSTINKEIMIDSMITNSYSLIDFGEKHYIGDVNNREDYGFKLINNKTDEKNKKFRIVFKIYDVQQKPLRKFKIKEINISYKIKSNLLNKIELYSEQNEYEEFERSIEVDKTYYMPIIIKLPSKDIYEIYKADEIIINMNIIIKNCFNICSKSKIHLIIKKDSSLEFRYNLDMRRIFYGDITYEK